MAQTFSESSQGVISVNVGNQPAGTAITLSAASGNTMITQTPELAFEIVILSSPGHCIGRKLYYYCRFCFQGSQSGLMKINRGAQIYSVPRLFLINIWIGVFL